MACPGPSSRELCVRAFTLQQFGMRSDLDHAALLHNDHQVRIADRAGFRHVETRLEREQRQFAETGFANKSCTCGEISCCTGTTGREGKGEIVGTDLVTQGRDGASIRAVGDLRFGRQLLEMARNSCDQAET